MSTRGCIGFRIDEVDKVTYNHCDSYPGGLGESVLMFIATTPIKELKTIAEKIQLVEERDKDGHDVPVDPEHLKRFNKYADPSVGESMDNTTVHTYYQLLRDAQGELNAYKEDLDIMIDGKEFLYEGLFCEYAYIINIDTGVLEFYSGFHQGEVKGRYNIPSEEKKEDDTYNGVSLLMEIPLKDIKTGNVSHWVDEMDKER